MAQADPAHPAQKNNGGTVKKPCGGNHEKETKEAETHRKKEDPWRRGDLLRVLL